MPISSKSKFAGFLRGLIGRSDDRALARPVASAAPAPSPAPAHSAAHGAASLAQAELAVPAGPDEIELPLAPVLAGLPIDLRSKLMATPSAGQTIRLQAEMVIQQLAFGAVRITFGELRQLSSGIFQNSGSELDNKLVNLPLQEILPRLNSALLARRTIKKVEVSDEIVGPFAERGRGFTFTTQPLKPAAPARTPAPEQPAPSPSAPIAFNPPASIRPVTPAPLTPQFPQRSVTPVPPPAAAPVVGHAPSMPASPQRSVTPTPVAGHETNGNGNGNGHSNGHGTSFTSGLRLSPRNGNGQVDAPAAAPAPVQPALPPQPTIYATLGDLCENWPEALKTEILCTALAQATVPLDGNIIFSGLKRGRIVMPWRQLRLLAQPSSGPSPNDNLELELPLKVIAPLFLAAQKTPARPQTKGAVSSEIPDLFFGFPQAAPAAPVTPVVPVAPMPAPAPAAPATPVSHAAPAAPAAPVAPVVPPLPRPSDRPQDTNFYVWGENGEVPETDEVGLQRSEVPQTDFMSRQTHPKDLVTRAMTMPGVAGSVVAMPDGMRVASQVPVELNADTVAAFLPQIFDRVNQSTRELRMGPLNNVSFTVGNVPWKIFRVNAVYFAAFGRAGQQLPSVQLAQLAGELDRKK